MAGIKKLAASAAKFDAISSLARTDDMLAVIGVVMLLGVLFSSYGAYWQGRYARASFKKECAGGTPASVADEKKKTTGFILLVILSVLIVTGLLVYIFKKNNNHAEAVVEAIATSNPE